jgi:DNA primase
MTAFGLGHAGGGSGGLCGHLADKGVSLEKAAEMTLIVKEGSGYKDRYYKRVMFPLMNVTGMVVGFSARTIDPHEKEKKIAKYINSSESNIFHKKDNLYAINRTKDSISAAGRTAILVEGQMDVVSVWQHGVTNVTASLGTALTEGQARLLHRFADRVVLAYDMDESGRDAATKGGMVLRSAGLDVAVMSLPSGKDPDEFIRAKGRNAFMEQAESAVPFLEYRLTRILGGYDMERKEGVVAFLREAAGVIAGMSPVERDYYVKWLEQVTGISASAIEEEAAMRGASSRKQGRVNRDYEDGDFAFGGGGAASGQDRGVAGRHVGDAYGGTTHDGSAAASGGGGGSSAVASDPAWAAAALDIQRGLIGLLVHEPAFLSDLCGRERQFTSPGLARIFLAVAGAIEGASASDAGDAARDVSALLDREDAEALREVTKGVFIEEDPARQLRNYLARLDEEELKDRRARVVKTRAGLLERDDYDRESVGQLTAEIDEIEKELAETRERG